MTRDDYFDPDTCATCGEPFAKDEVRRYGYQRIDGEETMASWHVACPAPSAEAYKQVKP